MRAHELSVGYSFGHRLTGQRFEYADLEGLTILAEHVSNSSRERASLRGNALQKTLAETLLDRFLRELWRLMRWNRPNV